MDLKLTIPQTIHNALKTNGQENPQDVDQHTTQNCTDKELLHVSLSDSESGHSNPSEAKAKDKTKDVIHKANNSLTKASLATAFESSCQNFPVRRKSVSKTITIRKITLGKKGIKDIRSFMDPTSGKRKTQETTPEKLPQVKIPST